MIFGEAEKAYLDFRNFLYVAWLEVGLPSPTRVQFDMANCLQNVIKPLLGLPVDPNFSTDYAPLWDEARQRPSDRVLYAAFRGVGKSWITSALVDWCLAIRPDLNVMVVSAAKSRADAFSIFSKQLIESLDFLHPLRPNKGQRYSNVAFDVGPAPPSHAPSVLSMGVMGTLTGGRADIIIADDIEVPNNSETQTMREKLSLRSTEFAAILKPGGVIIYLGTPQCEDSLYVSLEARRYRRIVWPARYPSVTWMKAHGHSLAPLIARALDADPALADGGGMDGRDGQPTDDRFDEEDLQGREAEYARSGFALQYQLDTSLSDTNRYPLKLADLLVMDLDPNMGPERLLWAAAPEHALQGVPNVGFRGDRYYSPMKVLGQLVPYQGSIMAIDPAGRGEDELAYAVLKHLNGYVYLMECRGLRGGYTPGNLETLAQVAKTWGVEKIVIEPNFGGGMFGELLKPVLGKIHKCLVEEAEWSRNQKEQRIIQTLEPVMNQHRLVINRKVLLLDGVAHPEDPIDKRVSRQLMHQLTRVTVERGCLKHDDRLDALALGVASWLKGMALDAERRVGEREGKDFDARVREMSRGGRIRIKTAKRPAAPSFLRRLLG